MSIFVYLSCILVCMHVFVVLAGLCVLLSCLQMCVLLSSHFCVCICSVCECVCMHTEVPSFMTVMFCIW